MRARYCLRCGGTLRRQGEGRTCPACGWQFFDNPAPTASVLIVRGPQVLLARRGVAPYKGHWDIVGGFVKPGETPEQAVHREAREEVGARVVVERLLGIFTDTYGRRGQSVLNTYYVGRLATETTAVRAGDDAADLRWFSLDRLPRMLAFTSNRKALRTLREQRRPVSSQRGPRRTETAARGSSPRVRRRSRT